MLAQSAGKVQENHDNYSWCISIKIVNNHHFTNKCSYFIQPGSDQLPEMTATHDTHVSPSLICVLVSCSSIAIEN